MSFEGEVIVLFLVLGRVVVDTGCKSRQARLPVEKNPDLRIDQSIPPLSFHNARK